VISLPIYLDYNATTPVDARVLETMLPYFSKKFGNAASKTHSFGWMAEEAVNHSRKQIADFIGCSEQEIIFTSGATEAINLAIKGVFEFYQSKGNRIITVKTEHKAVLDVCSSLEKKGAEIIYLSVNKDGLIDLNELEKAVTEKTILVSVMLANNETGVIQPMKEIAEIVHRKGSILMSDTTQAIGKIPLTSLPFGEGQGGVDLLCLSAHKFYGPKGIGALFVRRKNPRVNLISQIDGGGHERGLRSGTLNVPAVVGMGKAIEILMKTENWKLEIERINNLRNKLEKKLLEISGAKINGQNADRLPNTCNVFFEGIASEKLIMKTKDIAYSAGSACTSALMQPSHTLKAMGLSDNNSYSSIRLSLGRWTTETEIDFAIEKIKLAVEELRME